MIRELHSPLHTLTNDHATALCNNHHKYFDSPYFTSGKDLVEKAVIVLVYDWLRDMKWLCLLPGKERALKQNLNHGDFRQSLLLDQLAGGAPAYGDTI